MKKVLLVVLSLFIACSMAANASAWQIKMEEGVDAGDYWTFDIYFEGETTDALDGLNMSVGYDDSVTAYIGSTKYSYNDHSIESLRSYDWRGGFLPEDHNEDLNLIYNINGESNFGFEGTFLPEATGETLLGTLYFADQGNALDDTDVYFTYGSDLNPLAVESVTVNGQSFTNRELFITANTMSGNPVPVPAAVWLMGSGLCAIVGIRRRKN